MINLLPQKQKKHLFQLLLLREIQVGLIGLCIITFVLIVLLVPVYVTIHKQTQAINLGLNNLKNSESVIVDKNMNNVIDDINNKLAIFPKNISEVYPSNDIILPLTKHIVDGVSITGITYEKKSTTNNTVLPDIEVRGIAKSRIALLAFQKSLESDPMYNTVTVPISDFVKGKDIAFSILITTNL